MIVMSEKTKSNKKTRDTSSEDLKNRLHPAAGSEQPAAEQTTEPDPDTSSDVDIQELLKKYLPEYADEQSPVGVPEQPLSKPERTVQEPSVPAADDSTYRQPKKKGGLFSRFRSSSDARDSEPAAPDLSIFDRIADTGDEMAASAPEEPAPSEPLSEDMPTEETIPSRDTADADAAPSPEEEPTSEPEMDDTDLNLMVAFGLEDQLDRKAGAGTADKVAAQNDAGARELEEQQRRAAEYEYTERNQTPRIAEAYKYALNSLRIKIAAGALLTLLLFLFENITLFGVQFAGALDPAVYPVVYIMVSLQLMLLVCAVAYEQVLTGFRNLFTGRPTPESVTAVLAVFGVLYSAYAAAVSTQGIEPVMYNFAVAVCALMTMIFAYVNTKREVFSFNIVSSKKPKYVFRRIPATDASPESEAFGAVDSDNPDVLQIEKASFVDGYFNRTTAVLHTTRVYVAAMLTVVVAAAVLLAVFSSIGGSGAYHAVTIAYISVLAAIPMSMFFTYSYPFYKANKEAYENDSTIVGESSLDEYSGASIISFDDKNVFPSYGVKVQNIKIYNNHRIDRVLYYAASAFAAAGGPLCDVFDVATIEMGHSDEVEILGADIGYLETRVDGRHILFGRSGVLRELGVQLPEEVVEEDSYIEGDLSIMYMVLDDDLIAKLYIRYQMDADFEFILRQFTHNGTCVCVKTLDPNIDAEMIFSKVKGRNYPLKVIKNHEGDVDKQRVDSGIVTRGTTKSLLQVVSYCDMVLSVKRTNMIISIVSAIVSLAVMLIVSMSGNLSAIGSWLLVVNQLFWMIPAMLTTKLYIK